ncbi:hypothetical protein H7K45_01570 [Mycobacterium yunnanensis]|uniref:Uncharacterized protein n=1 Tax=Mycobacterium yunnanensis TaxID=368477 RepID=A0A9X2YGZ1_9MYCO|nr:hypothetical protein [Mycobacterium yunnanensis]MCV7419218.1 hypothetical protein [Mycobacterium yunnanensis]
MRLGTSGVVGLVAAAFAAGLIGGAPAAFADESCDPEVVACDAPGGFDSPGNVQINDAPTPSADEGYPFDNEWYFNPAGGGTALQPNEGSHSGGGGGATGGGGHR